MKKNISIDLLLALLAVNTMAFGVSVRAATTDFTANGDITVTGVTFQNTTVDMTIIDASTAEEWSFASGVFTVTNPGTFKVKASDPAVKSMKATVSTGQKACQNNSVPGTSYLTLPTDSDTYTIALSPSECAGVTSTSSGGGGGGGGSTTETTYQTYDPGTKKTSTTPKTVSAPEQTSADANLANVKSEAAMVATKTKAEVAQAIGKAIDAAKEAEYDKSIVGRVVSGAASVSSTVREKILTFVTYGSTTTDALGAGERGGVVNSFKEAFGKLPETDAEWEDVIKIANGRWPGQTDANREKTAEGNFEAIYLRAPDRTNPHDDAAVVIMAYGLRSRNRNLNSEKIAIKTYQHIFKRDPVTATAWDAVRAIAYSGATR